MNQGQDPLTPVTDGTDGKIIDVTSREPEIPARLPRPVQRTTAKPAGKMRIEVAGDDMTLSSLSGRIGKALSKFGCYSRADELVIWDDEISGLRSISADRLRTFAEDYIEFFGYNLKGETVVTSLTIDMARAVLASPQFHRRLPRILRVNSCPQPVVREGGQIELLPYGYDAEFKTLTVGTIDTIASIGKDEAVEELRKLFSEFEFINREQGVSVAVAMMVGMFIGTMLGTKSLRPALIVLANAEGAGKSLLVKIILLTVLGRAPIGTRPEREEEFEKLLLSIVREARPVLFLDNLRGTLASPRLEAFITAEEWTGRLLGRNETFTAANQATVFITGNGLTVSPDLRRRSLFIELTMRAERAEDRVFKQQLDDMVLTEKRPHILACLWSLIRNWETMGQPLSSRSHSAFPFWAEFVGGIVEAAGFSCPFETPHLTQPVDRNGDDMRRLVETMNEEQQYEFSTLVSIMREVGAFESIVGVDDSDDPNFPEIRKLKPAESSKLGRLLAGYDQRQVGDWRFIVEGKGHAKRFYKAALTE